MRAPVSVVAGVLYHERGLLAENHVRTARRVVVRCSAAKLGCITETSQGLCDRAVWPLESFLGLGMLADAGKSHSWCCTVVQTLLCFRYPLAVQRYRLYWYPSTHFDHESPKLLWRIFGLNSEEPQNLLITAWACCLLPGTACLVIIPSSLTHHPSVWQVTAGYICVCLHNAVHCANITCRNHVCGLSYTSLGTVGLG